MRMGRTLVVLVLLFLAGPLAAAGDDATALRAENAALRKQVGELKKLVGALQIEIRDLKAKVEAAEIRARHAPDAQPAKGATAVPERLRAPLQVGTAGLLWESVRITSIPSATDLIVDVIYLDRRTDEEVRQALWIAGVSTEGLVDGAIVPPGRWTVRIVGTKRYAAVGGGVRTILLAEPGKGDLQEKR